MPRCLIIQHLEPEGPYAIGEALTSAGVTPDVRRPFAGDGLPTDLAAWEGLVVMGGPMSASSDEGFPTRRAELELISDALERGVPTLGVCLGAQLLAIAAGGKVLPGADGPEVGWAPVSLSAAAPKDPLLNDLPEELTVLHWHWDTYEVPSDVVHLALSGRYGNQAFRCGTNAWGFQFHLEIDETAVAAFLDTFGADARSAGASPEQIAADSSVTLQELAPHRTRVLSRFAEMVAAHQLFQAG